MHTHNKALVGSKQKSVSTIVLSSIELPETTKYETIPLDEFLEYLLPHLDSDNRMILYQEFLEENPYRLAGGEQYELAIKIGASGYNQNCARCHGLEAISGGIAPDLRVLEDGLFGDEWYMERVRKGYSQNGAYKMPPFQELLSQEAMWAIRSYIESRPKPE